MNDADDLVAVIQSFEHVDEEVPPLPICQAMAHWLAEQFIRRRSNVDAAHLLFYASIRVVIGDEVDCAVKVGDNLVKPDDVRMLELLEIF